MATSELAPALNEGDMLVARIGVFRIIDAAGDIRDVVTAYDAGDTELDMATSVGMLALAQHALICERADVE